MTGRGPSVETTRRVVSTNTAPEREQSATTGPRLAGGSLGAVIGQFKSICTKRIRETGTSFRWQPGFYEHIIRDDESMERIRQYVIDNPLKWNSDEDMPENLWM